MRVDLTIPHGDEELMAWCREQGHDPALISTHVTVHPHEREVTLREYLLDENGRRYVDPSDRTRAAMREHRFRPTRPLPFNP